MLACVLLAYAGALRGSLSTRVTHQVRLGIGSPTGLSEEQVKWMLRRYLSERLKIGEIIEEKIRIE